VKGFGRYKGWDWEQVYRNRLASSRKFYKIPGRLPTALTDLNAKLLLEAVHRGPWRAVWAHFTDVVYETWQWYCGERWEWVRVHLLWRKPNEAMADAARTIDEWKAMDKMAEDL